MSIDMTDSRLAHPKPAKRATVKRRKARKADAVEKEVRMECAARDGACRLCFHGASAWASLSSGDQIPFPRPREYGGPSEWAHFGGKRRARTMGQPPEVRHTTAGSLMLCRTHHAQYDGRETPRLFITALSRKGCDGPLKFRRGKD